MRGKSLLLLMLALGCGLIASIGITRVMATRSTDAPDAAADMEAIYVALEDIPTGDKITAEIIKLEEWPKEKIPEDAIRELEAVVDQRPRSRIYAGQPILHRQLSEGNSATSHIPEGYRAVPVKVDAVSGGSSMIRPGDRVDISVHLQRNPAKQIPRNEVRLVLQDVKVFAVNDVYEAVDDSGEQIKAQTISLLVTPAQAQKVILAEESGKIRLVMRGTTGDDTAELDEVTMDELLGGSEVADRDKEAEAMAELDKLPGSPSDPSDEFIKFLQNQNAQTGPAVLAPEAPATVQWRMRLIAGNDVREQLMEIDADSLAAADTGGNGATAPGEGQPARPGGFSLWRLMSDVASSATKKADGAQPSDESKEAADEDAGPGDAPETESRPEGETEGPALEGEAAASGNGLANQAE